MGDGEQCPGGEACLLVTVTGTIHQQIVVTGDDLDDWQDMTDPPYRTHSPGSTQNEPRPHEATSIPSILRNLPTPVPVGSITFVSARASDDAHPTRLGPTDLGEPYTGNTGFQGNVVPGFSADTDRQLVRFTRPMRSNADLNYEDVWTSRSEGQASLVIHTTGHISHPQIKVGSGTAVAGKAVDLSAIFADNPPPPGPTYGWTFGDGTRSTAQAPKHTWTRKGTYLVTLETGASDGSEGTAVPVRVQVGPKPRPPADPGPRPGAGTGSNHNPATGPTTGTGTSSNGTTTPGTGSSGGEGATAGTGQSSGPSTSTPPSTSPSTSSRVRGRGTTSPVAGTRVSGILLVADATASSSSATKAAPVSAASARAVPQLSWDRSLLWLLVLPALLAIGGCTQTRWLVRRLPLLPWRSV